MRLRERPVLLGGQGRAPRDLEDAARLAAWVLLALVAALLAGMGGAR